MTHIMLDLESLSTSPKAAIIAIGACKFNFVTGRINDCFYRVIEINSALRYGLEIDQDTVIWWAHQSKEAREIFSVKAHPLKLALQDFKRFVGNKNSQGNARLWGNGAAFDNVILSQAYKAAGIERPWKDYGDYCYRTIKQMHPGVKFERIGVHHNALDDAKSQAAHLLKIYKAYGGNWAVV